MSAPQDAPKVGEDGPCAYRFSPNGATCGYWRNEHHARHAYIPPASPEPDTAERLEKLKENLDAAVADNERGEDPRGKWGADRSAVRAEIASRSLQGQIEANRQHATTQHDATGLAVAALYDRVAEAERKIARHGQRLDALEQPSYAAERIPGLSGTPATQVAPTESPANVREWCTCHATIAEHRAAEPAAARLPLYSYCITCDDHRAKEVEADLAAARRELGESRHKADDLEVAVRFLRRGKESAEAEVAELRARIEAVRAWHGNWSRNYGGKLIGLDAALGEPRNEEGK